MTTRLKIKHTNDLKVAAYTAMQDSPIKSAHLARLTGIHPSTMSQLRTGSAPISTERAIAILLALRHKIHVTQPTKPNYPPPPPPPPERILKYP